jgi:cell division protein FtsL
MARLLLVILLVATIASAVAVVHKRHQHRQLFVELSRLEQQRDELNIEFGRLQLEQATLTQAGRVDHWRAPGSG